jgi:hypothetical protein
MFVRTSFKIPLIIRIHGANSAKLSLITVMLSSPENIVRGRYVPITPRIIPPRVVLMIMPSLP